MLRLLVLSLFAVSLTSELSTSTRAEAGTSPLRCELLKNADPLCSTPNLSPLNEKTQQFLSVLGQEGCSEDPSSPQDRCALNHLSLVYAYQLSSRTAEILSRVPAQHYYALRDRFIQSTARCEEKGPTWQKVFHSLQSTLDKRSLDEIQAQHDARVKDTLKAQSMLDSIETSIADLEAHWPSSVVRSGEPSIPELMPCKAFLQVPMAAIQFKKDVNKVCGLGTMGITEDPQSIARQDDPMIECLSQFIVPRSTPTRCPADFKISPQEKKKSRAHSSG